MTPALPPEQSETGSNQRRHHIDSGPGVPGVSKKEAQSPQSSLEMEDYKGLPRGPPACHECTNSRRAACHVAIRQSLSSAGRGQPPLDSKPAMSCPCMERSIAYIKWLEVCSRHALLVYHTFQPVRPCLVCSESEQALLRQVKAKAVCSAIR